MNTLLQGYFSPTNDFNYHSKPMFHDESCGFGYGNGQVFDEFSLPSNELPSPVDGNGQVFDEFSHQPNELPVDGSSSSEGEVFDLRKELGQVQGDESDQGAIFKESDHSNAIITFISQMLMEEEDLENQPCMLHDCLALQATEKSYQDVLNNNSLAGVDSPNSQSCTTSVESAGWNQENSFASLVISSSSSQVQDLQYLGYSNASMSPGWSSGSSGLSQPQFQYDEKNVSPDFYSREKKNRRREDGELFQEIRSSKLSASSIREFEPSELSDKVLLCSQGDRAMLPCGEPGEIKVKKQVRELSKGSTRGRPKGGKKQGIVKDVVDLRSLLLQCAQAVSNFDSRTVNDLLAKIRQHSSPDGDGAERVAHYFADAIEARLAGNGPQSYAGGVFNKRISAAEVLKAYQAFIIACPFRKMSNVIANKTIKNLAVGAETLHIIDFGILYGYQWPCLIQALSEREGGPPKLRITGIDFPQAGFRPAERVEESGIRLRKYCERFGVPFEFNAIAQKWENVKVEDLKIRKDELLVVNSLYRLDNVPDETTMVDSPRDAVLKLIRKINPTMFIHGILNGTYNTPFFVTRFREALFHFSSMFDMFEATLNREDPHRKLFEKEVFGKDVMNILACEGSERVDRPETYKQWHVRNKRAGFRQVPLDPELVKYVRYRVKTDYHKDFSVDEDGKWMLQGWKGRVIHGLSFWRPSHNS